MRRKGVMRSSAQSERGGSSSARGLGGKRLTVSPCGWNRPWALAVFMAALFVAALALAFWKVLSPSVVFFAPDAPLEAPAFREALRRFLASPPTLQGVVGLLPFGFAYEGTFWVDAWVMCLAGVFLLRGRGTAWGAAWVGGFCAAFAGYFLTLFCAGHRGVVDALAVTCLCFGALLRAMRTLHARWFALLGALLAFGLGAQADVWLLTVCALGAYGLWLWVRECPCSRGTNALPRCFRCGWRAIRRRVGALLPRLALSAAVFLLVGWPALRHTFGAARETRAAQLAQASAGNASPEAMREAHWRFITDWSLPPEDLPELLVPGCRGNTTYPFDPKPYVGRMGSAAQTLRQHAIHLGWPALLLAAAAFLRKRGGETTRDRAFWAVLALVALLLALGRHTPLYRFVWQLPLIDHVRAPVKWLHLTGFAAAMLAGLGAEPIVRRLGNGAALALCALVAINGALVAKGFVFPIDLAPERTVRRLPPGTEVYAQPLLHGWLRAQGVCPTDRAPLPGMPGPEAALVLRPDGRGGFRLSLHPLKGGAR